MNNNNTDRLNVFKKRRDIINQLITSMKKGHIEMEKRWDPEAMCPHNALTKDKYKGINRLNLIATAIEKGYQDPRWLTKTQAEDMGAKIKDGEKGVECEGWQFYEKKKYIDPKTRKEEYRYDIYQTPKAIYYEVYNGEQIDGLAPYKTQRRKKPSQYTKLIDEFIASSECTIKEVAQEEAYYKYKEDEIILPAREAFKNEASFFYTLIHEMSHATGNSFRLGRDHRFRLGKNEYAKEEICAHLSTVFVCADLGLPIKGDLLQEESNYLLKWLKSCKNNYNEIFRAAADAEESAELLLQRYHLVVDRNLEEEDKQINDKADIGTKEKSKAKTKVKSMGKNIEVPRPLSNSLPPRGYCNDYSIDDDFDLE